MSVGAAFLQYVLDQLERTGRLTTRRMFGGVGLYCDDRFFGFIDDDTLFFKVDDSTRADYVSRGMKPFSPYKNKPDVSMSYYTVPADVLDDAEDLVQWARRSVAIATPRAAKKPKQKTRTTALSPKPLKPSLPAARRLRASSPKTKPQKTKRAKR
jgi:DNA transformation protein and related proteins